MDETIHAAVLGALRRGGVDFFLSVPCKLLAGMIRILEELPEVTYLPVTREEEGIGIASGAALGGRLPAILMQDSGLGNSINALTSLVQLYRLPMVLVISARGTPGETVGAQVPMGRLTPGLLEALGIPTLLCHDPAQVREIETMAGHAIVAESPVAVLLDFAFFGDKP